MKFDSNCISPGTQFMERLELTLKEFIMTKIDTDKYWRNCEIILSGSNVNEFILIFLIFLCYKM